MSRPWCAKPSRSVRRHARRGRWLVAFTFLLFVGSIAPVLSASASEGEEAAETPPPSAAELADLESEEAEYLEWLSSPEAVDQREASRDAYGDLAASEAKELILEAFPGQFEALNADPARVLSELEIEKSLGTNAALVAEEGDRSIVESSVPVESELGGDGEQPVDLSLQPAGGDFAPANPLTDVTLPGSAAGGIQLPSGLEVELPSGNDSEAQGLGDKNLFYPETDAATDTLVSPIGGGVEVFEQLRSPESPEEFRFDLNLPAGATLHATEAGGVEVLSTSGDPIAQVPAPSAVDAQGAVVPIQMSVEGQSLLLQVTHRASDLAYPILVDPDFLEEGYVSYDQWWPSANADYPLSKVSSLRAEAKGGGHVYDANTHGQWVYTVPGQTTYVAAASFFSNSFNLPSNCATEQPTNQPHGYAGLYNGSLNIYVGLGVWSGGSGYTPQYGTGWFGGAGVRQAVVGIGTGGSSAHHKCAFSFSVGGVTIQERDPEAPTVDWVGGTSSKWVKDLTITAHASDPGLGVKGITLSPEGASPHTDNPAGCTGTYSSRCWAGAQTTFGGSYFLEGERSAKISAFDPLGPDTESHISSTYQWTTKVDRSSPEVKLEGQLTEAIEEAEDEGDVSNEDVPQLSLPVYNLKIEAKDGSNAEGKAKRSGVKYIAVFVDGKEMTVPWGQQSCPASSCPMTEVYPLRLNGLMGGPVHHVDILATDQVGNVRDREIEFEYIPATGMKDEYVMQYFPLPDGEGNEAEEEHPSRPELAVNVMNGNLVYRQKDVDVEGPAVDLEVERFYNSQLPEEDNTEWGDGWTLAQTPELELEESKEKAPARASMVRTSGVLESAVGLPTESGGSRFDKKLQAVVTKEAGGAYTVEDQSGETDASMAFDGTGKVRELRTSGYAKVEYSYEKGDLSEMAVDDPASFGGAPPEDPVDGSLEAPAYLGSFGGSGSGPGKLSGPGGVATDSNGNVWVADTGHNRIQEFSPSGGFIRQFGAAGSGNGQLSSPQGIVFDSEGNLWVLDSNNNRLQKFSPKGEFLAQVGTKGSGGGQLYVPRGIAIDSSGNLWVADTYNHRVEKFSPKGEYLAQFGGKGAGNGQFSEPKGIAVDGKGNVWVADTANNRLQEFNSKGEFIRAVGSAGTGKGQFSKPTGIATDSEGNVWVADSENSRVQKLNPTGEYLAQFGSTGNDSGQLSEPQGVAIDGKGNVWVADTANNRVQEFAASEFVRKFGGEGSEAGQLSLPNGVATDSSGNVWVADTSHNRIQEFGPGGGFIRQFGAVGSGNGQLSSPRGIVIDSAGNLWVLDSGNHRLQKFGPKGEYLTQFGTVGSGNVQFSAPRGVAIDAAGNLWVADTANNRVQELSSAGAFIRKFGGKGTGNGQFSEPKGIAVDGKGNVWVADTANNRLQEFNSKGEFIRAVGSKGTEAGQFKVPAGVTVDGAGNLWVADSGNDRIQELGPTGEYLAQFGSTGNDSGQLSEPQGVAIDGKGNVWVADTANNRVQEFAASEFVRKFGGEGSEAGQLAGPGDVATDAMGNVWVADTSHSRIQEFGPDGEFLRQMGGKGSGDCQLSSPRGIALDSEGRLWVADSGNGRVQKFGVDGGCLSRFGSSGKENGQFGILSSLRDLAIDSAGHIWTVEAGTPTLAPTRVQEFGPKGEFIRAFGSEGSGNGQFSSPQGIAVDREGNVWVADTGNHRVQEFGPKGEFIRAFGEAGSGAGQFESPAALAFDSEGHLWIADSGRDRVQEFTVEGEYLAGFGSPGNDEGQLSQPRGIAIDYEGHIWIADTANNRVQKWRIPAYVPKHSSIYLSSFGAEGVEAGQLRHPADVAVDPEGSLWIADKVNNRIVEFDEAGEFIETFGKNVNQTALETGGSQAEKNLCTAASEDVCKAGEAGAADGQMDRPVSLALDAAGHVWVADKGNSRVQEFSEAGQYLDKFGSQGHGDGQLAEAEGIAIDRHDNVWVADTYNGRLQKFNAAGELIEVVGSYGSGKGQMGEPTGIDVGPNGNVWIADWQNNRVEEFDEAGNFIRQFGSYGGENGQFREPDGITVDNKGQVWVADEGNKRIQSFTPTGEYVSQFGAGGSGDGQFNLHWPLGLATDSKGKLWVADSENNRVQRWGVFNYASADEAFVVDSDPNVEVEVSNGLVESVEGEAAGETAYAHEGELLSAVEGPDGETDYEYDSKGRLTKVTLANGTWGQVAYGALDGRVESVTVDPAGAEPARTTYFSYQDSPSRRTTVSPEGARATIYDIATDGSVLKWWNTQVPPEIENLFGSLYANRETAKPVEVGDYELLIQAHSAEGIVAIEVIANGSSLVDEKTCDQDLKTPERECQTVEDPWVTNTGNWPPGILNLEVIVTDATGNVESAKFWVNIPYTPPPDPEADEPPTFDEVLRFREEFGLDLDLKGDEMAIDERIFNLIGDWYNPSTSNGEVARATADRWGVPLRAIDAAELEYRERYIAQVVTAIPNWVESHAPNTYAGYYVDQRQGGIIHIGFTSDQNSLVSELKSQGVLIAPERTDPFLTKPAFSLQVLNSVMDELPTRLQGEPGIIKILAKVGINIKSNVVEVASTDSMTAKAYFEQAFGSEVPIEMVSVGAKPVLRDRPRSRPKDQRLYGGDWLSGSGGYCSLGFGASEELLKKPNQESKFVHFALTAGHCFAVGHTVSRVFRKLPFEQGKYGEVKLGKITRRIYQMSSDGLFLSDGEAFRLEEIETPREIYLSSHRAPVSVKGVESFVVGSTLCTSGAYSGYHCGVATEPFLAFPGESMEYVVETTSITTQGDSGGSVWDAATGNAVGLIEGGYESTGPTWITPLRPVPLPHGVGTAPGLLEELDAPGGGSFNIVRGN